jgi:hypothetical protein
LHDVALVVDDEAKAPAPGKERHAMPPFILIDSPFTQAGDPSVAHSFLNERRLDPEALCDDGHINLKGAIFKLYHCHQRHHQLMCCDPQRKPAGLLLGFRTRPPALALDCQRDVPSALRTSSCKRKGADTPMTAISLSFRLSIGIVFRHTRDVGAFL